MEEVQQLKTNTRWKKDPKFAPSPAPPRKIIWNPDEAGRGRGEYRGRDRGRGGYRGRDGGRYRGRDRGRGGYHSRGGYRGKSRSTEKMSPPQHEYVEKNFPVLGNPKPSHGPKLNWREAAQKGSLAPPPIPKNTKPKMQNLKKEEINLDDYDEEEFVSDGEDNFPHKGGYID